MKDTFKFPNGGYEVTVLRKQDIIDCIDENIVDKEIALAIIEDCEKQVAEYIKRGEWVGIPYIGNVRVPKHKQISKSEEFKSLLDDSKEVLDKEQYIMFRKEVHLELDRNLKFERHYKYATSIAVNKDKKKYKKLVVRMGESYARLYFYGNSRIVPIEGDNEIERDYEC